MSIQLLSAPIDRAKLAALTSDFETIKYLENLQRDIGGPVSTGIGDSLSAAESAQSAADDAANSASNANDAAVGAQSTATSALGVAGAAQTLANGAQSDATYAKNLADVINADYISKTKVIAQSVASTFQAPSFFVAGLKVVGARNTGWTTSTGTPYKGAFSADFTYGASAAYSQIEAQNIAAGLKLANQRILALETVLRTHGLID